MIKKIFMVLSIVVANALMSAQAFSFCGFYVAKADTDLFNEASKVVMVRDGNRNVVTMANDYQGEAKDFAIVIPVPTVLKKQQIHITNNKLIDHLDAYTAPRLVEYHDSDPCMQMLMKSRATSMMESEMVMDSPISKAKALGVKIEEQYTVGEYDILILSAKESGGLQQWLDSEGYKVPAKARKVLSSYIKQGMKFFVAKVNLEKQESMGLSFLRPLQMAFESEKFMLPIRLGTVNAKGPQDMFVFALTKKGRVETTNYRTVKIPSNLDVPLFVKDDFDKFYTDMFEVQLKKEKNKAVFLEYAWNMSWCDPCAADPLSNEELQELGVFWLKDPARTKQIQPRPGSRMIMPPQQPANVYVTRLHVRYDAEHFPEDLKFQVTSNTDNYQGRYVMRHPWTGKSSCPEAQAYFDGLVERFDKEAKNLASLTDWTYTDIKQRMEKNGQSFKAIKVKTDKDEDDEPKDDKPWWENVWS